MTMNRGQAARRRVGKLPRRSKGQQSPSSSGGAQGSKAAANMPSSRKAPGSTSVKTDSVAGHGPQQASNKPAHDARSSIQHGGLDFAAASAPQPTTMLEIDASAGWSVQIKTLSDPEQQSERDKEREESESVSDDEVEEEEDEIEVVGSGHQEVSGSASGDEDENKAGKGKEKEDTSTSGYDSSSGSSDVSSTSGGSDASSSSSSSERTVPRDLKGCRAEINRIEAREALGLNLDDYKDRCLLENANLTREEIADVKDRAHRFNVKFTEATRAGDGKGWLEGTILRMQGVVLRFQGRAEGEGRRMTHAERHIVKMARMAMVDCQHVLAKERRREERRRGGG